MTDCIFCKIINKEVPADIFFEDKVCLVFVPLNPITKGHLLVIPKIHFENIFDIDDKILKSLITTSKNVAADVIKNNNAMANTNPVANGTQNSER